MPLIEDRSRPSSMAVASRCTSAPTAAVPASAVPAGRGGARPPAPPSTGSVLELLPRPLIVHAAPAASRAAAPSLRDVCNTLDPPGTTRRAAPARERGRSRQAGRAGCPAAQMVVKAVLTADRRRPDGPPVCRIRANTRQSSALVQYGVDPAAGRLLLAHLSVWSVCLVRVFRLSLLVQRSALRAPRSTVPMQPQASAGIGRRQVLQRHVDVPARQSGGVSAASCRFGRRDGS